MDYIVYNNPCQEIRLLTTKCPAGVSPPTGQQPEGVSPVVTSTQSTAPLTVTSKTGLVLPTSVDQQTDLNLVLTAAATYYRQAGCAASWATVYNVADAMRDASAVIVLYVAADGEQTAR